MASPTAMEAPHFFADAPVASEIGAVKAALRRDVGAVDHALGARDEAALLANLQVAITEWAPRAVAAFWPLRGEVDLRPLLPVLHAGGAVVLLPRIVAPDRPLGFARWTPETVLRPGPLGTAAPPAHDAETDPIPDLVLVPLLAFDDACNRLGRGGGYYDRTLASLPRTTVSVGVAGASRLVAQVPVAAHDRALDAVVTERGVLRARRAPADAPPDAR